MYVIRITHMSNIIYNVLKVRYLKGTSKLGSAKTELSQASKVRGVLHHRI